MGRGPVFLCKSASGEGLAKPIEERTDCRQIGAGQHRGASGISRLGRSGELGCRSWLRLRYALNLRRSGEPPIALWWALQCDLLPPAEISLLV